MHIHFNACQLLTSLYTTRHPTSTPPTTTSCVSTESPDTKPAPVRACGACAQCLAEHALALLCSQKRGSPRATIPGDKLSVRLRASAPVAARVRHALTNITDDNDDDDDAFSTVCMFLS